MNTLYLGDCLNVLRDNVPDMSSLNLNLTKELKGTIL